MKRFNGYESWAMLPLASRPGLSISTATDDDEGFICQHADMNARTQGWMPRSAYVRWVELGTVLISRLYGDRIGYVALSGGLQQPAVVRHNTIIETHREAGYGKLQMVAAGLWAWEKTMFTTMKVRTRGDIARQMKINGSIGGAVIEHDKNQHSNVKEEYINVFSVPLYPIVVAYAAGEYR